MTQYDLIADSYTRINSALPDRARIMVPTAAAYAGNLAGLDVLDLACGSGFYTRYLKEWGARSVLGLDISEEMIRIAEALRPEGVRYAVADVATMGVVGAFDFVFAGFLLHYAPDVARLQAMCTNIAANLKPGGRLVAFNENPFHPLHTTEKYAVIARALGPLRDGVEIERTHLSGGRRDFSFRHYHYEPETYGAALETAGFVDVRWGAFLKGADADAGLSDGFWDEYVSGEFSIAVLEAFRSSR